jgi:hypothetical protein
MCYSVLAFVFVLDLGYRFSCLLILALLAAISFSLVVGCVSFTVSGCVVCFPVDLLALTWFSASPKCQDFFSTAALNVVLLPLSSGMIWSSCQSLC